MLEGFLEVVGKAVDFSSNKIGVHHPAIELFERQILRLEPLAGQMLRHTAYVPGYGHPVVIQNDK